MVILLLALSVFSTGLHAQCKLTFSNSVLILKAFQLNYTMKHKRNGRVCFVITAGLKLNTSLYLVKKPTYFYKVKHNNLNF